MKYGTKALLATGLATVVASGAAYGEVAWSNSIEAQRVKDALAHPERLGQQATVRAIDKAANPSDPLAVAAMTGFTVLLMAGAVVGMTGPSEGISEAQEI